MLRRGCDGSRRDGRSSARSTASAPSSRSTSRSRRSRSTRRSSRATSSRSSISVAKILGTPTFAEDELARLQRETRRRARRGARQRSRARADRPSARTLFGGHPYGRTLARHGRRRSPTIDARRRCARIYARTSSAATSVIGFAGDIDAERAERLARALIVARFPGRPRPATVLGDPQPLDGRQPRLRRQARAHADADPHRQRSARSPHDPDHVPLVVANAVFGGTFTSRLMREVRGKRGWSYGASARLAIDRQAPRVHDVDVPGRHRRARVHRARALAAREAPSRAASRRASSRSSSATSSRSHAFEIDTAPKRVHQALDVELLGLPRDYHDRYLEHVAAVTLGERERGAARAPRREEPRHRRRRYGRDDARRGEGDDPEPRERRGRAVRRRSARWRRSS